MKDTTPNKKEQASYEDVTFQSYMLCKNVNATQGEAQTSHKKCHKYMKQCDMAGQ